MAGDHGPGAAVLLEPAHRPQPRLEATVVGVEVVLACRPVSCHAAGSNSSKTTG
jgi:hypothetical protein